jgi:hypothetical protein
MKKLKKLQNTSFRLERMLDSLDVGFKFGFSNSSEITDYRILTYESFWNSGEMYKKWYLLDELKFSGGGPNSAIYNIKNLDKNVIRLTDEQLRDLKLELLLQDENGF